LLLTVWDYGLFNFAAGVPLRGSRIVITSLGKLLRGMLTLKNDNLFVKVFFNYPEQLEKILMNIGTE
jgi:hypothetical protein